MVMKKTLLFIFFICASISCMAHIYPIPKAEVYCDGNIDPLETGVRTNYPPSVNTVFEGTMYVLGATGYKLVVNSKISPTAVSIIKRPIPPEAIQDKIMPVYKALLLLAGNDSALIVDTQHKLITFGKARGNGS